MGLEFIDLLYIRENAYRQKFFLNKLLKMLDRAKRENKNAMHSKRHFVTVNVKSSIRSLAF